MTEWGQAPQRKHGDRQHFQGRIHYNVRRRELHDRDHVRNNHRYLDDYNWQPLSILCIGIVIVDLYLSLYLTRHKFVIPLIAKYIFRDQFMSEKSAEGLFNVLTSYVFAIGGIWIIVALFY